MELELSIDLEPDELVRRLTEAAWEQIDWSLGERDPGGATGLAAEAVTKDLPEDLIVHIAVPRLLQTAPEPTYYGEAPIVLEYLRDTLYTVIRDALWERGQQEGLISANA